jgi:hypothetical protein
MEISKDAPQKTKIGLSFDPTIPLLGIYSEECKSTYNRDTCTPIFMAVLFILTKLWKQPRCPTNDEQIKKM